MMAAHGPTCDCLVSSAYGRGSAAFTRAGWPPEARIRNDATAVWDLYGKIGLVDRKGFTVLCRR